MYCKLTKIEVQNVCRDTHLRLSKPLGAESVPTPRMLMAVGNVLPEEVVIRRVITNLEPLAVKTSVLGLNQSGTTLTPTRSTASSGR